MYSSLAKGLIKTKNYGSRDGQKICKITPHHMNAHWTGKKCAEYFKDTTRQASANYCIGYAGDIWCSVEEENRAWTSSSRTNDGMAITIECANSSLKYPYPISPETWNSLVNLCVDICERYNFKLEFDGTPNGSLTAHRFFADTDCPGDYLFKKLPELAQIVNTIVEAHKNLSLRDIADLDLYQSLYDDLKVFKGDKEALWEHLTTKGIKEGRRFSYVYDPYWYMNYKDLKKAFGSDFNAYVQHFLSYGIKENRQAIKVYAVDYYKKKNKDLSKMSNKDLVKHFLAFGINEWRETSKEFNVKAYRDNYKDLQNAYGNKCKDYFWHYIKYGEKEGRNPTYNKGFLRW